MDLFKHFLFGFLGIGIGCAANTIWDFLSETIRVDSQLWRVRHRRRLREQRWVEKYMRGLAGVEEAPQSLFGGQTPRPEDLEALRRLAAEAGIAGLGKEEPLDSAAKAENE